MISLLLGRLAAERAAAETSARYTRLVLVGLWIVVTAYNIFKPYHIDDSAHLLIAQWIVDHPFRPMSGILNWEGINEPIWKTNQPHLYFYLMAAWGAVFGFSETAMHSLGSVFSLAAIVLFYRLTKGFAPTHARWATAMLALGPAFIVEQNMMVDVPLLAVWLAFFCLLCLGNGSKRQTLRYVLAATACSAALLIKYSSLVLFCILLLSLIVERRWRQAWIPLIPIAVLGIWSAFNLFDYGGVHILDRPINDSTESFFTHIEGMSNAALATLGGLLPLGFVALAEVWRRQTVAVSTYAAVTGLLIAAAVAVGAGLITDSAVDPWLARVFKVNAVLMIVALWPHVLPIARTRWLKGDDARSTASLLMLLAWLGATSVFYVVLSPFIAPRHVLLVLPPLLILFAARSGVGLPVRAKVWSLALTVAVSAGLCVSDWRLADYPRQEAARLGADRNSRGREWAWGHWGWQWYTGRQHFPQLDVLSSPVEVGDKIYAAEWPGVRNPPATRKLKLVQQSSQPGAIYNLFCTGRPAAFYATTLGMPPWTLSRRCQATSSVFEVVRPR